MTRLLQFAAGLALFLSLTSPLAGAQRKILYVDSYDESYAWSAGITRGIQKVLAGRAEVELQILRMDTKKNPADDFKKAAALKVKDFIESWHPDLVIASDDNASKYLIAPYFKGSHLPFVFCGVNWDVTDYGFPAPNVTGMLEVQLIDQILKVLGQYAAGPRVAFLKGDDFSARKEAEFFEKRFEISLGKRFVTNFAGWKQEYLALQQQADMLLLGNNASIKGWNAAEAESFILANTRIPTGNWDAWMAPFCLVTFANSPEEQGEWAASTALNILSGTSPADIPIATNKQAKIFLNMKLARILGIKFPIDLLERATFTSALGPG